MSQFSYDERKSAIEDIDFTAYAGWTIALVSETGSGKSTLLSLLLWFYDVKARTIRIDGRDIRDVTLASLRDAIGVVPQNAFLFNRSIEDNVRYAKLDATDNEVMDACKAAGIHGKILSLPEGYKTIVGEGGIRLSSGEAQRISIARVILKKPEIILLDEAISAVDSSTEARIQEEFQTLSTGRTTFIIAHRLSTIKNANLILVTHEGKIAERGRHDKLLHLNGRYQNLWSLQSAKDGLRDDLFAN